MAVESKSPNAWTQAEILSALGGGALAVQARAVAEAVAGRRGAPGGDEAAAAWLRDARFGVLACGMSAMKSYEEGFRTALSVVATRSSVRSLEKLRASGATNVDIAKAASCGAIVLGVAPTIGALRLRTILLICAGDVFSVSECAPIGAVIRSSALGVPFQTPTFIRSEVETCRDWIGGRPTLAELAELLDFNGTVASIITAAGGLAKLRADTAESIWDAAEDSSGGDKERIKELREKLVEGQRLADAMTGEANRLAQQEMKELYEGVDAIEKEMRRKASEYTSTRSVTLHELAMGLLAVPVDAREIPESEVPTEKREAWRAHCQKLNGDEALRTGMPDAAATEKRLAEVMTANAFKRDIEGGDLVHRAVDLCMGQAHLVSKDGEAGVDLANGSLMALWTHGDRSEGGDK